MRYALSFILVLGFAVIGGPDIYAQNADGAAIYGSKLFGGDLVATATPHTSTAPSGAETFHALLFPSPNSGPAMADIPSRTRAHRSANLTAN